MAVNRRGVKIQEVKAKLTDPQKVKKFIKSENKIIKSMTVTIAQLLLMHVWQTAAISPEALTISFKGEIALNTR